MGNGASSEMSSDELTTYSELLYLKKSEILHLYGRSKSMGPEVRTDRTFRYDAITVGLSFPEIRYNPFQDRIFHVFSSKSDGMMSFEDVLDFFSATSRRCPQSVKAAWAFKIYDFDGDGHIGREDIIEMIGRLVGGGNDESDAFDVNDAADIADAILEDLDLDKTGGVISAEFAHAVMKMPDFIDSFRVKP